MNLLGVMGAVVISVLIAIGVFARPTDPYPNVTLNAIKTVDGTLTGASNAATTTSDGTTVRFAPNGQGGTAITVFAARPDAAAQPSTLENYSIPDVAVTTADGTATFRIVVAHDGSGSFIEDTGPAWQQVTTAPSSCTTVTLRFGNGSAWKTATVSCTTLSVTAD